MKQHKNGHSPSGRSRRRHRDAAAGQGQNSSVAPVTHSPETADDASAAAAEVAVASVSEEQNLPVVPAVAEARLVPAPESPVPGSAAAEGDETFRESPAPGALKATVSVRARAEQIINEHVPLAAGAGLIPLPGIDLAAIGGVQLKLLGSLARHYEVPFTQVQAQLIVTSLLGSVGTTLLAGAALVSVAKFVPFFGTVMGAASMPVAGAMITRALGHLSIEHFEAGGTMETFDLDVAQEAFLRKIIEAKAALA